MQVFISGNDLMKRWGISPYELLDRFIKHGLVAYNDQGHELSPQELFDGIEDTRRDTDKIMDWKSVKLPGSDERAQQMLAQLGDLYFDEPHVIDLESSFGLSGAEKDEKPAKLKPHHTEKHRLRAIAVAAELWDGKYKDLSVPELIETQEMIEATYKNPETKINYSARTVKDWIKDRCPNPPLKGAPTKKKSN